MNRIAALAFGAAMLAVCPLHAQSGNPVSTELKQMYTGVKNNWIKMAEKMPAEDYGYKPSPDIRPFGQMVAHVADSNARTCSAIGGEAKSVDAASKTSKADLVAALKQSFDMCDAVFDSLTDAKAMSMVKTPRGERSTIGMLAGAISHSNEEYGYTAVYLRMKGITPPSSERR